MSTEQNTPCTSCASPFRGGTFVNGKIELDTQLETVPATALKSFTNTGGQPIKIIIANIQKIRNSHPLSSQSDESAPCIQKLEKCLVEAFNLPDIWFSAWCQKSGAFFGFEETYAPNETADGSNETADGLDGKPDGHITWCRVDVKQTQPDDWKDNPQKQDYQWWKTNFVTRWQASTGRTTILILDPIPQVEKFLTAHLEKRWQAPNEAMKTLSSSDSPYYVASLLIEAAIGIHDKAVWGISNLVRAAEKVREKSDALTPKSTLDTGMRHCLHVSETLDSTIDIVEDMLERHKSWLKDYVENQRSDPSRASRKTTSGLLNTRTALKALLKRSRANEGRLTHEKQLSNHALNLHIASLTQADSSAMRSLTYVATAFLPAAFVANIFSTSFFTTDNATNSWVFHNGQFWIFCVFAGSFTFVALLWLWLKRHPSWWEEQLKSGAHRLQGVADDQDLRVEEQHAMTGQATLNRVLTSVSQVVPQPGRRLRSNSVIPLGSVRGTRDASDIA